MKIPRGGQGGAKLEMKMTSMIDVVFLLLIFFVCTASFRQPEERLPTHLLAQGKGAADVQAPPDPIEPLRVRVHRSDGEDGALVWTLAGRAILERKSLRQTLSALAQAAPETPVIVDPEPSTPIGDVIDLYDLCRIAGFAKIQFAAKL